MVNKSIVDKDAGFPRHMLFCLLMIISAIATVGTTFLANGTSTTSFIKYVLPDEELIGARAFKNESATRGKTNTKFLLLL